MLGLIVSIIVIGLIAGALAGADVVAGLVGPDLAERHPPSLEDGVVLTGQERGDDLAGLTVRSVTVAGAPAVWARSGDELVVTVGGHT